MRKFLLFTAVVAAGLFTAGIEVTAQSYSSPSPGMRYNGPPYGSSDKMMGGIPIAPGTMTRPAYDRGAMMGHGRDGRRPGYRGNRLCWKETDSARGFGYYALCSN